MKKYVLFFLCIGFIFTIHAAAQSSQIKYTLIPETPRPGEPVTIGVNSAVRRAVLLANEKQLSKAAFFPVPASGGKPGFMAAILAVPSTASPGAAVIRLETGDGAVSEIPLTIADREFISETIALNQTLTGLITETDPQKTAEAELLWAILNRTGNEIYHSGTFILPVSSTRRTSIFGTRRVYKYPNGRSSTSIHAGVGFGVPTGTQIIVSGSGKVVLARMRIVTGNTVIVEHAPGVYSLYYHLDKIETQEGDMVSAGTLIGLAGATGFATGPHLHWELRVSGENTDPDIFVIRPILDKDLIISKIFN